MTDKADARTASENICDSELRTLLERAGRHAIPVAGELFGIEYSDQARVRRLPTEELAVSGSNAEDVRIVLDSFLSVRDDAREDNIHFEVAARPDESVWERFVEQDGVFAAGNIRINEDGSFVIPYPRSGLICLRPLQGGPKEKTLFLYTSFGRVSHRMRVLYAADYDLDAIREKGLVFLAPFLLFRHADELDAIENDPELLSRLRAELSDRAAYYRELRNDGAISDGELGVFLEATRRVCLGLAAERESIREAIEAALG